MNFFDVLSLIGGLALFMFGMQIMGDSLEKKAGGQLNTVLGKITDNKVKGFALGASVTAVVQSSSATTVMLVGFVNSGIIQLKQAISVLMGANVGTTITAWVLSLTGIDSDSFMVQMLKPSSFTPVLSLIGVILFMFIKDSAKRDTGMILLGFAVLMTGMYTMSDAVSGLKDVPGFTNALLLFSNPVFGVIAGAILTAIIQSSSASVGILQALSSTGAITFSSAIPIIMGQNIGTCVTAMISSIGANKNAKRVAFAHLYFNAIGAIVLLALFYLVNAFVDFSFLNARVNEFEIAIVHTAFNLLCTAIWLPFAGLLEKLAMLTVKDDNKGEKYELLDERLMNTPSIAIEQAEEKTRMMAIDSCNACKQAEKLLFEYSRTKAEKVRKLEDKADFYEDNIGAYLVKLSGQNVSERDGHAITKLLKLLGDFERISDHAVNIVESSEEIHSKGIKFSAEAQKEIAIISEAVEEILGLTEDAFINNNIEAALCVEPLEQVIDILEEQIKLHHVLRLQMSECSIEHGFVLSDILTSLERVSDHCSNIAACVIEIDANDTIDTHRYLANVRTNTVQYDQKFKEYQSKYSL